MVFANRAAGSLPVARSRFAITCEHRVDFEVGSRALHAISRPARRADHLEIDVFVPQSTPYWVNSVKPTTRRRQPEPARPHMYISLVGEQTCTYTKVVHHSRSLGYEIGMDIRPDRLQSTQPRS